MRSYRIALLPGDGIGPEVVAEAVRCLRELPGLKLEFEELSVGAEEYLRSGDPLPQSAFDRLTEFDAVLLGAMGLPAVRWPDGTEMTPQIDLRERLDLYCGLRPVRLYAESDSVLRNPGRLDILLVRENTEGLFASRLQKPDLSADLVRDSLLVTRPASERLFRAAFEQARRRRKHLTLVDKANVLPSMAFFRKIFDEVAAGYPDVATDRIYVDAAALYLVRSPERFDVLVTENMYGDILSDLLAGLVGGMGMAPSADIGERYGVFQPSHGTAPDIAGQGIANPIATILSAAMMLEWLGATDEASLLSNAVETALADPQARTRDVGGTLSTTAMTDAVLRALQRSKPASPGL